MPRSLLVVLAALTALALPVTAHAGKPRWADDGDFGDLVREADRPVLVLFTAPWCMECRATLAALEDLAETRDDVRFVLVNTDRAWDAADRHDVRRVPTLLLFRDGRVLDRRHEAPNRRELAEFVEVVLEGDGERDR